MKTTSGSNPRLGSPTKVRRFRKKTSLRSSFRLEKPRPATPSGGLFFITGNYLSLTQRRGSVKLRRHEPLPAFQTTASQHCPSGGTPLATRRIARAGRRTGQITAQGYDIGASHPAFRRQRKGMEKCTSAVHLPAN